VDDQAVWSLLFKLEGENAQLRRVIDDTNRRIGGLERTVGRSSKAIGVNFEQVGRGAAQMGRGINQTAQGVDRIVTRVAAAGVGLAAFAVTTAASFEQASAGFRKTVDGTAQQLDALENDLKNLSRTTPVAFEELAGIAASGGALGIAREDLLDFTDIIARLSVSTDLTADAAATAFGQLSNVLDMSSSDMRRFADALVALGNDGASTESQIVEMAARFGAAGRQADLTNEQILALASTVASMGIEVEAGGSSLSRLFNQTTLNIGTASDEAIAFADALNVSLADLATRWDRDANGTFIQLLEHIESLDKYAATSFLEEIGITNVRDINAIMLLSQGVEEYQRQLGVATDETGALNRESDAFFNTTQGKWQTTVNNVRLAADVLGGELLPVINEVMDDFVEWLTLPENQRGLERFARDLAGDVRGLVSEIRNADFGPLLEMLKGSAAIAKSAFDAFQALPDPVKQLLLAAIVANKVTGGGLGMIAGGLGNILGGALKIGFGLRGSSPTNPMWVAMAGGGLPGLAGAAGAAGGGGLGGLLGRIVKSAFGPAFVAAIGLEIGAAIAGPAYQASVAPARDFERRQVDEILSGGDADRTRRAIAVLDAEIADWAKKPRELQGVMQGYIDTIKTQRDELAASLPKTPQGLTVRSMSDAAGSDQALLQQFGGALEKLSTGEFLTALAKTTEMGLVGIGTSIEVGVTKGMDPIGDNFRRLAERADNPLDPPVMTEISNHIIGLEELQAQYLATGDIHLAAKVQGNIDALHTLIGSVDTQNAIADRAIADAAAADVAMLNSVAAQTVATADNGAKLLGVSGAVGGVKASVDAMHSTLASKNLGSVTYKGGDTYIAGTKTYGSIPKFAEGTWDVPNTGLAMLHEGEMVVPRFDSAMFREIAAGGGGGDSGRRGPEQIHVHLEDKLKVRSVRHIGMQLRRLGDLGQLAPQER